MRSANGTIRRSSRSWRGAETIGLEADAAEQERPPLRDGERLPTASHHLEDVALGQLDRSQVGDRERAAVGSLVQGRVVLELDLGVEAAGQHPLVMVADHLIGDPDVLQLQARQGREVGVAADVEPGRDQVDELDRALLPGPRLEQLMGAGAHGPVAELALDDLEALGDLVGVGAGAVAAEQELADVGRDRVLALELEGQVLADDEAVERLGRDLVEALISSFDIVLAPSPCHRPPPISGSP